MHVFSAAASIELLDGAACASLALAAALRGRSLGANLAGVLALGCMCALSPGLIRELPLHGQQGARLILASLPQIALAGSLAGIILFAAAKKRASQFFFLMDSLSMSLTAALCACLAAPELGAIGALALGACAGLLPGLIRDAALGDSALFLEQPWHAASAILAALCAVIIILLPAFWTLPAFFVERIGEWAVVCGSILALALRYWKGR